MLKRKRVRNIVEAVLTIGFGVLCLVMRGDLLHLMLVVLGAMLVIGGVVDLVLRREIVIGVVKGVIGVFAITMAWDPVTIEILLYLLAVVMTFYGILGILQVLVNRSSGIKGGVNSTIRPVVHLAIGIALFVHQPGVVTWFFIVAGMLFIAVGVLSIAAAVSGD